MDLVIDISGDVVEWQDLLNGTCIATLDGASPDGAWTLSGSVAWDTRSGGHAIEGDITLSAADGSELFGSLADGEVAEIAEDAADAGYVMRLEYDIDGGAGEFASAIGSAAVQGGLSRERFHGRWTITLPRSG
ncbi:MAG: hypothetical protein HY874_06600 [Chloroflexi bacterium]|nr:hypothetical protein [Chloroflexota bacterium]